MKKTLHRLTVLCMVMALMATSMISVSAQTESATYHVELGDSLTSIAAQYETDVETLRALNNMSAGDTLYAGDDILVPSAEESDDPEAVLPEIPEAPTAEPASEQASAAVDAYDASAPIDRDGSSVSVSFKDANIKDVLSILALELNRSVIYTGDDDVVISFQLNSVTPMKAFETALALADMTYIQDGDIYIAGDRNDITEGFLNKASITRFSLHYITSDMVSSQLGTVGLDAELILSDENPKAIWVQGFPAELSKVSQVIYALDRSENLMAGSAELKNNFTAIDTYYITAAELSDVLNQCRLPAGIVIGSSPKTLFVFASTADLDAINAIKGIVDIPKASLTDELFTVYLSNATAQEMESKLSALGIPDVQLYTSALPQFAKSIIVSCSADQIENVRRAIVSLDVPSSVVTLPVDSAEGDSASRNLSNRRTLISEMSGISASAFKISSNISKNNDTPRYVMYLTASPEDIQLVRDIIAEIDGI